jgi:hypothetical protein
LKLLGQAKACEWHQAIVHANIDIFEMSCEVSISYFKRLKNLEKIRRIINPDLSTVPVDYKKSVISIVGKSSKNLKGSNVWCHCCDKNNYNRADCREISKFKNQKNSCFEAKSGPGKNSFAFLFEEINALKRKL